MYIVGAMAAYSARGVCVCSSLYRNARCKHQESLKKSTGSETGHNRCQLFLPVNMKYSVIQRVFTVETNIKDHTKSVTAN